MMISQLQQLRVRLRVRVRHNKHYKNDSHHHNCSSKRIQPFGQQTVNTTTTSSLLWFTTRRCMSMSTINTDTIGTTDTSKISSKSIPISVAIVGSGPSGCYTAKYLLAEFDKQLQEINSNYNANVDVNANANANNIDHDKMNMNMNMNMHMHIDVIDRLPTPFGLVRSGVAPDHPEVKNVQNDFSSLFDSYSHSRHSTCTTTNVNNTTITHNDNNNNKHERNKNSLEFRGNVTIGRDISLLELQSLYHIVILAYGCESDRKLNIPGESNLKGVLPARQFVAWYNAHPDYIHLSHFIQQLLHQNIHTTNTNANTNVVIIGHGNVALDCARILAKGSAGIGLHNTDIPNYALPILSSSSSHPNDTQQHHHHQQHITILGRRGHVQAPFTIKELRELTKLEQQQQQQEDYNNDTTSITNTGVIGCNNTGIQFKVLSEDLDRGMTKTTQMELKVGSQARAKSRIDQLLRDVAATSSSPTDTDIDTDEETTCSRYIHLRFLLNPIEFLPKDPSSSSSSSKNNDNDNDNNYNDDRNRLGYVLCEKTKLVGDEPGKQQAIGTGEFEKIPADLALVSIGYKGVPIQGLQDESFDVQKGIVKHENGRVITFPTTTTTTNTNGKLYVSGWLKRGPSGIIGSNISDAKETVSTILNDIFSRNSSSNSITTSLLVDIIKCDKKGRLGLDKLLKEKGVSVVDWLDYKKIDAVERDPSRCRSIHQPREKLYSIDEMLNVIQSFK